jgi:hypothetical protein
LIQCNGSLKAIAERLYRRRYFTAVDNNPVDPGSSRRLRHGDIFPAGSAVRESGIYEVLHDQDHRPSHEVVMIADNLFPACDLCDASVRYRVVRTAPYIFSDEDFEEPS